MRLGLSPFKSQSVASVETPGFQWTEPTPHASTRIVYVSKAGSDANDGLSELTPKLTIAAGVALLRDGFPDWLLLRRGDTWVHERFGNWAKSGLDATNKMLIGAYGTGARPIIDCSQQPWFTQAATPRSYIAIVSIQFTVLSRGGSENIVGISGFGGHDILFEDVSIDNFTIGFSFTESGASGRPTNYQFRRCQIFDIYTTTGGGIGVFFDLCDGIVFEECMLDYCGWHAGSGAADGRHNTYFQNTCGPIVFKNCTSSRSSLEGIKARSGGEITGNLFLANKDVSDFYNGINDAVFAVTPAQFNDNVAIESRLQNLADLTGSSAGVRMAAVHNWEFKRNIIAHNTLLPASVSTITSSWNLRDATSVYGTRGVSDCVFEGNITYKWWGPVRFINTAADPAYFHDLSFTDNVFHEPFNDSDTSGSKSRVLTVSAALDASITFGGNTYYSLWTASEWFAVGASTYAVAAFNTLVGDTTSVGSDISGSWPNPDADVGDYLASIGEANANDPWTDIDTLMGLMRVNHKEGPWNDAHSAPAVRDWFRANFGLAPV